MKEQLYTIPVNEAFDTNDECPFCFIEREVEKDLLDFVLGSGSSYMESDIREATDNAGFCRMHFKKMFDYGNTLGNAWILKTHYEKMLNEMQEEFKKFSPKRTSFKDKFKKNTDNENSIGQWITKKEASCYICNGFHNTFQRYMDTFFYLYNNEPEFRKKVNSSKGFCLSHFGQLCSMSDKKLNNNIKAEFYDALLPLMMTNMQRMSDDVSWMVEKFDYRNKDADWKDSKDAIQRGMQKLKGGYPSDQPYKSTK